jgi:hypothetical protein
MRLVGVVLFANNDEWQTSSCDMMVKALV